MRPDFAKRQREKELLELTIEATHHDDYTDVITGRYNNLFFHKTLKSYLTEFNQADQTLGFIFIEILGEDDVPKDVLKEVGNSLVNTARDYDIVARIDLNRFAVITPYIKPEDIQSISNRLRLKLSEAREIPAKYDFVIGTAYNQNTQETPEKILDLAGKNLAVSKRLKLEK